MHWRVMKTPIPRYAKTGKWGMTGAHRTDWTDTSDNPAAPFSRISLGVVRKSQYNKEERKIRYHYPFHFMQL